MKMKQISAATIKDAMATARRELGEDAVLIDQKKAANGGIVVTFAVDEPDKKCCSSRRTPPPRATANILPFTPEIPKPANDRKDRARPSRLRHHLRSDGIPRRAHGACRAS